MIRPDEPIAFTLTGSEVDIVFAGLAEMAYKVSAPVIERLKQQVLAHDPSAFDRPHMNGEASSLVPN